MSVDVGRQTDQVEPCDHEWRLGELQVTRKGIDRVNVCGRCGEQAWELPPDQAARPPL
jgi:hypothetical protein